MTTKLRFDSRVAIVTGAGSGLGRACALALAQRGARVVVNDIGTCYQGKPETTYLADTVTEEIVKAGGQAVSNHDSVEYGDLVVRAALEAFGQVDIVINCAEIIRSQSFAKMTASDWDLTMRVNLRGTYLVVKAAWPHMRQQKFGRVVNLCSAMGVYGGKNASATAASRLGVHGFTKALSTEGAKINVRVNSIAPIKVAQQILSSESEARFSVEKVVPLVVWLAHPDCLETGELFEVGGGVVSKLRLQRTEGHIFHGPFTVEDVNQNWSTIIDFSRKSDSPANIDEAIAKIKRPHPRL